MSKIIIVLISCLGLAACKKEATTSRTYLLTAKNWRVTAATHTTTVNGQSVVTDDYATYPACDCDDYLKFNSDNSVVRDQGALKCDASAPQTYSAHWHFNDAQTQLTYLPLGYATWPGDIIELSASTLHIRLNPSPYYTAGTSPGPTSDIIYTSF